MSSSLSSSSTTVPVSSVQLARDPNETPTDSSSAIPVSTTSVSPASTNSPAASPTTSSSNDAKSLTSALPPPTSTGNDKVNPASPSSSSDTSDASPTPDSHILAIPTATSISATSTSSTPLTSNIFDTPIPSHLTSISSQLLLPLTPLSLLSTLDSSPSQPTTFSILRRPTPILGIPTSTNPNPSSATPSISSPATKRTNSSGVITGVLLAVLFFLMAVFVLRPQWSRKREVVIEGEGREGGGGEESEFDAESTWKEGGDSRSSSEEISSMEKVDTHFVTFPRSRPIEEVRSPTLITPPPLPPTAPQRHSTPPLSGLYSPSAWATLLGTPESRRCLTPTALPNPLPNHNTNSPNPSINISTFPRSDTPSGYASIHHHNNPIRSSLRTTIYDPSDTSSIYSSQTFNIGSPKLGSSGGGSGVFGRSGMGTEKMGLGMGMGMLLPVALVKGSGGLGTSDEAFPTTPGSDCPERF